MGDEVWTVDWMDRAILAESAVAELKAALAELKAENEDLKRYCARADLEVVELREELRLLARQAAEMASWYDRKLREYRAAMSE